MGFGDLQRNRYPVNVITSRYYYVGKFEPKGPIMTWLNDADYLAVRLLEFNGAALDAGATIDTVTRDETILMKTDIAAVDVLAEEARKSVPLMQRVQKAVFYTDSFVFNCSFPASAEARLDQLLDSLKGDFFPILNVQMFPLRAVRPAVFRSSEMVLLNRRHVTHYHGM